ncbi:MAG: amidase, partial [Hyphomicrobiaceae bacterium]
MARDPTAQSRVETALIRVAEENDVTRIFISLCREQSILDAAASDARRQAGNGLGPLDGRIVGIKDNLAVGGLASTLGFGCFRDRISDNDAHAVSRLRQAGAIVLGTLNMHEGALGATTDNPHFGRCANPLRRDYTPGGSSGGSAAAVASGLVDFALGTDTMGSVRLPAAFCGTVGFKPSRGAVGRSGLGLLSPTLDTIGPLAATTAMAGAAFAALMGPDSQDLDWTGPASLAQSAEPQIALSQLRIGVPRQLSDVDVEAEVLAAFAQLRSHLETTGVEVVDVDLAGWWPTKARRAGLLISEAEAASLWPGLLDDRQDGVSDTFKAMLRFGQNAPASKLLDAFAEMRRAAAAFQRVCLAVDAIMMPTAPQRPFHHQQPTPANQADL